MGLFFHCLCSVVHLFSGDPFLFFKNKSCFSMVNTGLALNNKKCGNIYLNVPNSKHLCGGSNCMDAIDRAQLVFNPEYS